MELFLELHEVDPATTRKLRAQLKNATDAFGDRQPDPLSRLEVEQWRKTLSAGSRHDVFRAFRQVLAWASDRKLAVSNPSAGITRFRHREWPPAVRTGGIDHRRVYDCRHTFATWAIEDSRLSLIHVPQIMGTSVRQIEDTYFRWLSRTDEQIREALDAYDESLAVRSATS